MEKLTSAENISSVKQDWAYFYERRSRKDWGTLGSIAIIALFASVWAKDFYFSFFVARGQIFPIWPFLGIILAILFFCLVLRDILRNESWGSRIHLDTGELVRWSCRLVNGNPETVNTIHIREIGRIETTDTDDGIILKLFREDGSQVKGFNETLVPSNPKQWAYQMSENYPHIVYRFG
ncbi:hypothetical protein [Roseibium sediminis]|uniref:hypothetical protein n=1 Tax=Roseibium sediminis TaxID=1775174 RepID=UPI00123CE15A|nr:hypothetical protein [Roseibium sediminis]